MMYVGQIIKLYTLNLYSAVCKLYLNKTGGRGDNQICQWRRIETPEIDPHIYGQLIFGKGAKAMQNGESFQQMMLE